MAPSIKLMLKRHVIRMSAMAILLAVGLSFLAAGLHSAKVEWTETADLRDARQHALVRLRNVLGYGGLVHNALNAVLRPDGRYAGEALEDIGMAHGALHDFDPLNSSPLERSALAAIHESLDNLNIAFRAYETGAMARLTPEEAYLEFEPDFRRLASSVETLAATAFPETDGSASYQRLLSSLEAAMGLNGFVHHLKAALLTSDQARLEMARAAYTEALELVGTLQQRAESSDELEALRVLENTVRQYGSAIETAAEMIRDGASATQIDARIQVNDNPALSAYSTLLGFELQRIESRTAQVGSSILSGRNVAIALLLIFCVPFVLQFLRVTSEFRKRLPGWMGTINGAMDSLVHDDFDANHDFQGLPAEFASLEEPLSALRRKMRKRKEALTEATARLETYEAKAGRAEEQARHLREELEAVIERAEAAEAASAEWERASEQMGAVLDGFSHGVITTDAGGHIIFWNSQAAKTLGFPEDWFDADRTLWDLILYLAARGDLGTGEPWSKAKEMFSSLENALAKGGFKVDQPLADGRVLALEFNPKSDGSLVVSAVDVTERHARTKAMERQATSDPLTKLPNRAGLDEFINTMAKHAQRSRELMAIVAIDLDGFKPVNDEHGHAAGDEVLVEIAKRLSEQIRETDCAARIGGDEFVLVLTHLEESQSAERFTRRLLRSFDEPIEIAEGASVGITGSAGIAMFPTDGTDTKALIRRADDALYEAKRSGKNRYALAKDVEAEESKAPRLVKR